MREIKFRAFVKKEQKMVYGRRALSVKMFTPNYAYLNNEVEIMQYTGLKDKNGNEIYEGDILLFNNSHNDRNNKWICVVKYREGGFVCEYPVDGVYNHFDSWNVPKVTWEVIGNIYENPELLEVAE